MCKKFEQNNYFIKIYTHTLSIVSVYNCVHIYIQNKSMATYVRMCVYKI